LHRYLSDHNDDRVDKAASPTAASLPTSSTLGA